MGSGHEKNISVDPYLKMYYSAHRLNDLIFVHAFTNYGKLHTLF